MLDILAMEEQLTGEYKRVFSKISMYGTMTPLDYEKYEDRVLNIYDTLMAAQQDGKPVERIVGRDIEVFCRKYFEHQDRSEVLGSLFKRIFRVMLVLVAYSVVELVFALTDEGNRVSFMNIEVNAAPFLVGLIVGLVVICIENVAKHKLLMKTDKINNGIYGIGTLVILLICVAVGIVLFSDIDAKMPLWFMLAISGGYSVMYLLVSGIVRYAKTGTLKNTGRVDRKELKEFNKEITLEYDIRTSAEGMAEQFDKLKRKYAKKGKEEPTFSDFVNKMRSDHKATKYIEIFFVIFICAIAVVNIATSIGNADMIIGIIAAVIIAALTLVIFKFAMTAIKEVEVAQCIILDECDKKAIDIYEYIAIMQEKEDKKMSVTQ